MKKAKILFLDIETCPSLGYVWGKWQQDVIDFARDWYILSYAAKWIDEKTVHTQTLIDYPDFKKDMENDKNLVADLWKLLDEAEIVIAHNGDKFDIPKINTRFISHKMAPPSPYRTVDTLKIARRRFKFDSNKLDELGRYLGLGRKLPHTGFHLWKGCMVGDSESWRIMRKYNRRDVILLEKIYLRLRAWDNSHPKVCPTVPDSCPKCGSQEAQRRGLSYTAFRQKQRYRCKKCFGWFEGPAKKIE